MENYKDARNTFECFWCINSSSKLVKSSHLFPEWYSALALIEKVGQAEASIMLNIGESVLYKWIRNADKISNPEVLCIKS